MLDDPFLNYFALGLLIFVVVVNSYVIIAILRKLCGVSQRTSIPDPLTLDRRNIRAGC
jgi:hypothetical protein